MYKANSLLGKTLINQATGERIATVGDIVFTSNYQNVAALLFGGGLFSSPKVIPWSAVASIGDVVVVHNQEFASLKDDQEIDSIVKNAPRITGTSVLNEGGEKLGTVEDILISERGGVIGYQVKTGLLSKRLLPASATKAVGKDAIIGEASAMTDISNAETIGKDFIDSGMKDTRPTNPPINNVPTDK